MVKFSLHIVIFLIVFYCLACIYLFVKQDSFIFFPHKLLASNSDMMAQYQSEEITFQRDNVVLRGWFINRRISQNNPLIIYYGGNAEEVSDNLYALHHFDRGSFLFVNYRGYGNSTGKPSEEALFKDALYVFDRMKEKYGISAEHIVVMGRSLGSAVACYVAANRKVGGVILVTPFASMLNLAKKVYPYYPVGLLLKYKFDSLSRAPQIKSPLLVLLAGEDSIVPMEESLKLVNAWGGTANSVVIDNAGHNDLVGYLKYWEAINLFLSKLS